MKRLDIDVYDNAAPLQSVELTTPRAVMPLKQHAGAPAIAKVKPGQTLAMGEVIAEPAPDAMGAVLHAPFACTVAAVESSRIILNAI